MEFINFWLTEVQETFVFVQPEVVIEQLKTVRFVIMFTSVRRAKYYLRFSLSLNLQLANYLPNFSFFLLISIRS